MPQITPPFTGTNPLTSNSPASGDVSGTLPGPITVTALQGVPVCVTAPSLGDVLTFDGTDWCPAAPTGAALEVKEVDGAPDVTGVTQIIVPNGSLTDNTGGSVSIAFSGGSVAAKEDGSTVVASATGFDFRHGLDVTASGSDALVAVDESELTYGAVGDITASAPADTALAGAVAKPADAGHKHAREAKPYSVLNVIVNGRGAVPSTGIVNFGIPFKFAATLIEWTILGDLNGTCTFDLWTKAYASYPPAVGDTMVGGGGTKPNIGSAGRKATGTPTGWAKTTFATGDVLIVNLDAVATFTVLNLALTIRRDSST